MSLKAYDGMMSRKNIKYIQDGIVERLDRLKEKSENKIAEKYAELFFEHVDKEMDIVKRIGYDAHEESDLKNKISEIKIEDDTTMLSYIYQAAKILSVGYFRNDFTVHLNISLQAINNRKILVYPNIIVHEHKPILLEFLEDWYCQNSCDADENVSKRQWKQREKDWYNFNEIDGFNMKIQLFDPNNSQHSLIRNFRGEELINRILKYIPSDEKRIRKIARNAIIDNYEKEQKLKNEKASVWGIVDRLSKEGNTEVDDYIKANNIIVTTIDANFIKTALLKPNPLGELRKEKLNSINEKILESKS